MYKIPNYKEVAMILISLTQYHYIDELTDEERHALKDAATLCRTIYGLLNESEV